MFTEEQAGARLSSGLLRLTARPTAPCGAPGHARARESPLLRPEPVCRVLWGLHTSKSSLCPWTQGGH